MKDGPLELSVGKVKADGKPHGVAVARCFAAKHDRQEDQNNV